MRTKAEKFGATAGAVIALLSGAAAIGAYERISDVKHYCKVHHIGKAACQNTDNLPKAVAKEETVGNTLGIGGALGIGVGVMLGSVALGKPHEERKELVITDGAGLEYIIADTSGLSDSEPVQVPAVAGD